jgi:ergothioneine biosynthesis protein EgtB
MAFVSSPLSVAADAAALPAHFQAVRAQSAALVQPLLPEDTVVQPSLDVSPPKWHLAHTTWFWETMLLQRFLPGYEVFHPEYAYLFNSYYNSLGSRVNRADRGTLSRPPLADVYRYRAYVDAHMATLLSQLAELPAAAIELVELGLHHEQQHQELLATDIKYILSTNPLAPGYLAQPSQSAATRPADFASPAASARPATWLPVPGGIYPIGHQQEGFSFDNELPVHEALIAPFELQNRLVTNADFLQFIEAGGYRQFQFWLGEGWDLVNRAGWTAPLYWSQAADGQWLRYGPTGLAPLRLAAPVSHISFYEADAYAQWAGARLPTEAEWETAARYFQATPQGGNWLETGHFDPQPLAADADLTQCHQLLGDCWEWTYSPYHPYPGYQRAAGALGEYNGKFMINQLVLRGGSCATPESHIRLTYRNFFHADKRWQFTGLRLAR